MPDIETTISDALFVKDASLLSDDQIRQFEANPELLDLITNRETVAHKSLWYVLGIAAFLVAGSKTLRVTYGDAFEKFFFNVAADLVFEMGAALIGSAATVIFLGYQQRRQFADNLAFRANIIQRIKDLNQSPKDT